MIEVYKILHNIYDKEVTTGILNLSSNTSTRGSLLNDHVWNYEENFAVMVVKPWNSLSEEVVIVSQRQGVRIKTG